MARARVRTFRSRKRLSTVWVGVLIVPTGVAPSGSAVVGVLNAAALDLRPFTILRMRGVLFYSTDQVIADEGYGGAFGMIVVTDSAAAIGVTAVPTPLTETDASWVVWEPFFGQYYVNVGATGGKNESLQTRTFDSKSKRKVGHDDDVVVVFEADSTDGTIMAMKARMLVQLH